MFDSLSSNSGNGANYRGSFAIMTSLFFLWGFLTVFSDMPMLKERL
jgi:fucose permease